jgi:hypothetical protein
MSFYNCASLTSITLPDSIRIIEESAFNSCEGITNLIIPNGVTTIGYGAIRDCTNLKDITIPDSVTTIGDYAITRYSTLIHYGGTEKQWKQLMTNNPEAEYYLKNNMVYCTDKTVLPSGSCGDNLTWTYDIVTGILTISGTGDMYNFDSHPISATDAPWSTYIYVINKIIIDDGVTSIGEYAFYGCSNLSDVIIGDGVTTIGENAFSYCDSLISVTIGNGVTTIKEYAFYECEGLTSVIIPVSVTNMDNDAFYGCPGITDVYYEGTEEQWLGYYVYPEGSLINLNRPFTKSTIHYNYHIHKYDSTVTPPTCTEQGYTTYTCECGDSYVADYVDALGHTEEIIPAVAPTCTETGLTAGVKCSECGEIITEQQEIPAIGHNYSSVVIAPTCTEQGYTTYTCECGESYIDDYIDSTGHSYTSEITTSATHTTIGVITFTCSCGDTYTETIEKTADHNYDAIITLPTCTEQGYTTYTCECADTYVDDYVNATGHADNDNNGYCDTCSETVEVETPSDDCDCECHQTGIKKIIYVIILFFQRLLGLNKTCDCGIIHY